MSHYLYVVYEEVFEVGTVLHWHITSYLPISGIGVILVKSLCPFFFYVRLTSQFDWGRKNLFLLQCIKIKFVKIWGKITFGKSLGWEFPIGKDFPNLFVSDDILQEGSECWLHEMICA